MDISLPSDCGNAPRIAIVSDFVTNWAQGDAAAVQEQLAVEATWTIIGEGEFSGHEVAVRAAPRLEADRLELLSVITHGRFAACDGYLAAGETRMSFSHMFCFTSTGNTAKVRNVRSYRILEPHR